MRGFIIFLLISMVGMFWFVDVFNSGKFQKYLDTHPDQTWGVRAQYYTATFHFFRKNHEKSIYAAGQVLKLYPKSPFAERALYLQGKNYEFMEQNAKAAEIYGKFLEAYPKSARYTLVKRKHERLGSF